MTSVPSAHGGHRRDAGAVQSPVLAGHEARAWADLVLRGYARATNLSFAGTQFLLVGTGSVADALAGALARFGGAVVLAADDPIELLAISRRYGIPARLIRATPFVTPDVDVLVTTGRGHPPLTAEAIAAGERSLVVLNAAPPAEASAGTLDAGGPLSTVRSLTQFGGPRPIFTAPRVDPGQLDQAIATARSTHARLVTAFGADEADAELAKALLA
ncbi:hypothetical protein A5722_22940 [Mycobacterium vulneris]|nr:hypothetical protein A5722_22940 [Mycolicibacterium vulneris]OCB65116.1 hypothetical protein A5729_17815 [Mycolicibacterium vulneris]